MHWNQSGGNDPVVGSTVPDAGNALGLGPLRSKIWVNLIRFVLYLQLYSRILEAD